jgi:hypothetical protein
MGYYFSEFFIKSVAELIPEIFSGLFIIELSSFFSSYFFSKVSADLVTSLFY